MVLVKPGAEAESGRIPDPAMIEAMGKFNEEMVQAGVMLAADGLRPTSDGVRMRYPGGRPTVVDGPFTETKELIGGFWILQVKSRDEAIEWMKRAPFGETEEIEIRPIWEFEDFRDQLLAETRERELRLRPQQQGR
jgi:hypothetical protein